MSVVLNHINAWAYLSAEERDAAIEDLPEHAFYTLTEEVNSFFTLHWYDPANPHMELLGGLLIPVTHELAAQAVGLSDAEIYRRVSAMLYEGLDVCFYAANDVYTAQVFTRTCCGERRKQ